MCTACSCTTDTTSQTTDSAPGAEVSHYTVTGMTCGHCVISVTEQIQELGGVRDVSVDLASGTVAVTSDQPVAPEAVAAAVREAGYQVA
jgi:copper chaperone CopZ